MYPDYVSPDEVMSSASSPEEISRAYRRFGARFAVDSEGVLSLRLDLNLEEVGKIVAGETHLLTCGDPVIAELVRRVGPLGWSSAAAAGPPRLTGHSSVP
jgi:hypothetical protein